MEYLYGNFFFLILELYFQLQVFTYVMSCFSIQIFFDDMLIRNIFLIYPNKKPSVWEGLKNK